MHFPRLLSWKRMLVLTSIFPCSYRTCTMQKNVKTAVWCRRYPLKMKKPYCKSSVLWRTYHLLLAVYEGKIARRKREYPNCSFGMTLISFEPSSNSHINTETSQNKQLYSNQDAIYREQTATLHRESPNAARL